MQLLVRSFFLGFLIGVSALLIQVIFDILLSSVITTSFSLENFASRYSFGIILFFTLAALIEETLRYIFTYHFHKTLPSSLNIKDVFIYGVCIGVGFTVFEVILFNAGKNSFSLSALSTVLFTHIAASVFIMFGVSRKIHHFFIIITAVFLHTLLNSLNFLIFT